MKLISLFAGAGGLDKGFKDAGFNIIWANEYDKKIWETYQYNHPEAYLDKRGISDIHKEDVPQNVEGIIGGPPCQAWSLAGAMRGANDPRGQIAHDYIRLLKTIKPPFFVMENVPGLLSKTHKESFIRMIDPMREYYNISFQILNAVDFGVPQERQRVFVIGYRNDTNFYFDFSVLLKTNKVMTLRDAIEDLCSPGMEPLPTKSKSYPEHELPFPNHEYMVGGFSSIYMSRNRKRDWDEPSFTIQAGGRHAPLHPAANPMIKLGPDSWKFDENTIDLYKRLSVRECARVQTFPDDFKFFYDRIADGYMLVGNAVPVKLAFHIAKQIYLDLYSTKKDSFDYGYDGQGIIRHPSSPVI